MPLGWRHPSRYISLSSCSFLIIVAQYPRVAIVSLVAMLPTWTLMHSPVIISRVWKINYHFLTKAYGRNIDINNFSPRFFINFVFLYLNYIYIYIYIKIPIFMKIASKVAQDLKEKSNESAVRGKNFAKLSRETSRGGGFHPPGWIRVKLTTMLPTAMSYKHKDTI